jgi:alpha-amylase
MRSICFYFQVHQPYRLRSYRFFDIGEDHNYYDDFQNSHIARRVADKCYLPANKLMLDHIKKYGDAFKISYSISGTALDQFEKFTPDVIKSFRDLVDTGCVEILSETYSHSLSSLISKDEFEAQVNAHREKIESLFGVSPKTFRNTELIYSDQIGEMVADMGYRTMLTEGAKHVLGWKSPNYMYCNAINPKLKLLLKNFQLSDDIAFRFSQQSWDEWPLTTEKFAGWLNDIDSKQEVVNLFMDYETFGEHQWPETGIFEFLKALPDKVFSLTNYSFNTPSELSEKMQPVSAVHVPHPISWADEERDLTAWLGNELQDEAFEKLYNIEYKVRTLDNKDIQRDWKYLQTSDHFYYMCTKWFSDGDVHKYFNPYGTPYEAFINYMNVLADFQIRVDELWNEKTQAVKQQAKEESIPKQSRKRKRSKLSRNISIDDLSGLSDAKLKQLIKAVDNITLVFALKGAKQNVRDRLLGLMGKRALQQFENFDRKTENPRKSDLVSSRKKFESVLKKLF